MPMYDSNDGLFLCMMKPMTVNDSLCMRIVPMVMMDCSYTLYYAHVWPINSQHFLFLLSMNPLIASTLGGLSVYPCAIDVKERCTYSVLSYSAFSLIHLSQTLITD
jgi:hypothetical protein